MTISDINDSILQEFDISFKSNSELLYQILKLANNICKKYPTVPIRFYKDRISIFQTDYAKIFLYDIEIAKKGLLDYEPGEPNYNEKDYKLAILNTNDILKEYKQFFNKDDIITVKIDTKYRNRIEFILPSKVILWAKIKVSQSQQEIKRYDRIPIKIKSIQENKNIPVASIVFNNYYLKLLFRSAKSKDADKKCLFELDNENGLQITSGDEKEKGTSINIDVEPTSKDQGINFDIDNANDLDKIRQFMLTYNKYVNPKRINNDGRLGYATSKNAKIKQSIIIDMGHLAHFDIDSRTDLTLEIRDHQPLLIDFNYTEDIRILFSVAPYEQSQN